VIDTGTTAPVFSHPLVRIPRDDIFPLSDLRHYLEVSSVGRAPGRRCPARAFLQLRSRRGRSAGSVPEHHPALRRLADDGVVGRPDQGGRKGSTPSLSRPVAADRVVTFTFSARLGHQLEPSGVLFSCSKGHSTAAASWCNIHRRAGQGRPGSHRPRSRQMKSPMAERGARYSIVYRATDPQTRAIPNRSPGWDWESKEAVRGDTSWYNHPPNWAPALTCVPTSKLSSSFWRTNGVPSLDVAVAGGTLQAVNAGGHRLRARYHIIPGIFRRRHCSPTSTHPPSTGFYVELLRTHVVKGASCSHPRPLNGVHQTIAAALKDATSWGKVPAQRGRSGLSPKPVKYKMATWLPAPVATIRRQCG